MVGNVIAKLKVRMFRFFTGRTFKAFGANVTFLRPFMISNPDCIEIGDNVFIREYARIEAIKSDGGTSFTPVLKIKSGAHIEQFFHVGACEYVEIGENALIAGRVFISDHNHAFEDVTKPIQSQGVLPGGPVIIGENAWLGEGCVILPGVTVGKGAIVGANAVVTRDVPAHAIVAGSPARVIRQYDMKLGSWERVR